MTNQSRRFKWDGVVLPMDHLEHGSRTTYTKAGCRCQACTEANRDYQQRYRRVQASLKASGHMEYRYKP